MTAFRNAFLGMPRPRGEEGLRKLMSGRVNLASSVNIVMSRFMDFPNKLLLLRHFVPVVDGSALDILLSKDGGGIYDTGASFYSYAFRTLDSSGTTGDTAADNVSIGLTNAFIGNQTPEGVDAAITIYNTNDADHWPRMTWQATYMDNTSTPRITTSWGTALRRNAQITNALQLFFFGSDIASGYWDLYGYT